MSFDRKLETKQEEDQALSPHLSPAVHQIALGYLEDGDVDVKSELKPYPFKGLKLFNAEQDILTFLSNRLQLDINKHADLRILLSKYPYLLDNNKPLADVLFPGMHQTTVNSLADYYVLWGELDELKLLLQRHPHLLNQITEARDPAGRRIQGTLYQKALGAGDFEMAAMLKEFLTPEEEDKQYRDQFPKGFEKEAEKKLAANMKALEEFWESLKEAKTENNRTEENLAALKIECKSAIDNFKKHLSSENEKPITSGYHFDLQFLLKAVGHINQKKDEIGGWWTHKEYVFWGEIFNSIQLRVSARDMHELVRGLYHFDEKNPAPRTLVYKSDLLSEGVYSEENMLMATGRDMNEYMWNIMRCQNVYKTYIEQKQQRGKIYSATRQSEKGSLLDNVDSPSTSPAIAAKR